MSTDASLTADELRLKVSGLLVMSGRRWEEIDAVVLASVVPRLTLAWEELSRAAGGPKSTTASCVAIWRRWRSGLT